VSNVVQGLIEFSEAWGTIATELLATKEPWDFSKAPKGGAAKIVSLEFAGFFITVAKRALDHKERLFERRPFVNAYARAELVPHRRKFSSLKSVERIKLKRRIQSLVAADVAVMVEYGLFETTTQNYVYKITTKGAEIYEQLENTQLKPSSGSGSVLPNVPPGNSSRNTRRHNRTRTVTPRTKKKPDDEAA
jgi:hypothetical protein